MRSNLFKTKTNDMRKFYSLLICLFTVFFLSAQNVDPKLAEALQNTLDSMRQTLGINGLGAALQLPNNAVWAGGSGISTFFPLDSVGPEHRFATGSTTKTITGACILQLADEGVLSLDDSLHTWVPSFEHIDSSITIQQLLRHQSGIADVLQNPSFNFAMSQDINKIWSLEEVISSFIQPPNFQPGTGWAYSNTNYLLLGLIIETATGHSYHQEIEDRFFSPMGLVSYANPAFDPLPNPAAHLWLDITGDGILDDAFDFLTSRKSIFSSVGPAGGYFATPSDLAIWTRASMSGSLFSPDIWTKATETIATSFPGDTRYGLGLTTRSYLGFPGYGHGGDLGGYATQAYYFPEKDISIVAIGNDASIVSWNLTNTLNALLLTYLNCEPLINNTAEKEHPDLTMEVFPNPFIEKLTVRLQIPEGVNIVHFSLMDVSGKTIWFSAPQIVINSNELKKELKGFSNLSSGIYFLNIFLEGKLVKSSTLNKIVSP